MVHGCGSLYTHARMPLVTHNHAVTPTQHIIVCVGVRVCGFRLELGDIMATFLHNVTVQFTGGYCDITLRNVIGCDDGVLQA